MIAVGTNGLVYTDDRTTSPENPVEILRGSC